MAKPESSMATEGHKQHIPIDRMREVIIDGGVEFASAEQAHVESCDSCLHVFAQLMMSNWDG